MYWFKVSFLRGSPSAFDAWWHANNPLLGATEHHVHWCEGSKAGCIERWLSRPLIGLFPSIIYLCIGLRCRFCEVHRRHLMHGGTQTIRFWGLQHVHWCEGSCCWFLRLQSRLVWEVAIQAVDWFVPEHHLSMYWFKVSFLRGSPSAFDAWWHAKTIRFWGLQHVHWCEGSCCWFLRLQSRLVWEVAIQAVDWFVPEHHLSMYWFKVSFLRGSPSAFDAWWHANNPLLGATTCPLVWRLMLLVLAAAKQVGLRGGYPGRWLVCSRASSIYIGLRCRFCEVHRRHLMHGGTQTIRFWGYNMSTGVKAHVAGSCGCKAGWFERWLSRPLIGLFPSIIYLCIGLRCRFCEVHRRHLMHGGTQTIRFWGLQHVHWCEGSCCWFLRLQSRLVSGGYPGRRLVCSRASSIYIGLRYRFCEVHRRHLMHGGTQTIRFWGLQHVHWCEGSCCWFLRLQSRLVWEVAIQAVLVCSRASSMYWFKAVFARFTVGIWCMVARKQSAFGGYNMSTGVKAHVAGSCGCKAGWFERWLSRPLIDAWFDAWWHANNPLLGATTCPLVWRLMLLVLAAAKQVGLRGSPSAFDAWWHANNPLIVHWCEGSCLVLAELQSMYPGRWLVCSRRCLFLRGSPSAFDAWWHANNPLLGATTCPLVWRLMLLVLAAAKQVGLRGGYPGRWLVCSRASSIYVLV